MLLNSVVILLFGLISQLGIQQVDGWSLTNFFWTELRSTAPICYGDLGCFERFPPTNDLTLPSWSTELTSFYPDQPENVSVTFYVYSCKSKYRPAILSWNASDEEIKNTKVYDPNLRTIFIVHGYLDLYTEMNWMGDMKDFILFNQVKLLENHCKHNVIGVDWHQGALQGFYQQAVSNTMMVGANIGWLIWRFNKLFGNMPENFTVVGHSLGSHVSGFVGKDVQRRFNGKKLRNIIGLDPAGPWFTDQNSTHRLNPNDATLVLTIQTNGGPVGDHFGILQPLGHYSFFPNGGQTQPGCEKTHGISNILLNGVGVGLSDTLACSHRRATRLVQFNETLLTDARSMGVRCDNYDDYIRGKCGDCSKPHQCIPFSQWFEWWQEQVPHKGWTEPIKYYLNTAAIIPFSMFNLQVIITTGQFEPVSGTLEVTLQGVLRDGVPQKVGETPTSGSAINIQPNTNYTILFTNPKDLGKVKKAWIKYIPDRYISTVSMPIKIDKLLVNFINHPDISVRSRASSVLKPSTDTLQEYESKEFNAV